MSPARLAVCQLALAGIHIGSNRSKTVSKTCNAFRVSEADSLAPVWTLATAGSLTTRPMLGNGRLVDRPHRLRASVFRWSVGPDGFGSLHPVKQYQFVTERTGTGWMPHSNSCATRNLFSKTIDVHVELFTKCPSVGQTNYPDSALF
jgi:hypothetical protein